MVYQRHKNCQISITICPGLRRTGQNFFPFTIGVVGGTFLEVIAQIYSKCKQGDVASRLDPEIPGPRNGAPLVDADGWREIDRLGAWECAMNMFSSMEEVPFCFRVGWGKAVSRVIAAILDATNQEELDRALK